MCSYLPQFSAKVSHLCLKLFGYFGSNLSFFCFTGHQTLTCSHLAEVKLKNIWDGFHMPATALTPVKENLIWNFYWTLIAYVKRITVTFRRELHSASVTNFQKEESKKSRLMEQISQLCPATHSSSLTASSLGTSDSVKGAHVQQSLCEGWSTPCTGKSTSLCTYLKKRTL